MKLNLQQARGAMKSIAEGSPTSLEEMGLIPTDIEKLTADISWRNNERVKIQRILENVLHASVDQMGINRFELPAEYVAAGIGMFVHPCNQMKACVWMEGGKSAAQLGSNSTIDSISSTVKAPQLFALLVGMNSNDEAKQFQQQFKTRVGIAILKTATATATTAPTK